MYAFSSRVADSVVHPGPPGLRTLDFGLWRGRVDGNFNARSSEFRISGLGTRDSRSQDLGRIWDLRIENREAGD